jgi:hypothetical protein
MFVQNLFIIKPLLKLNVQIGTSFYLKAPCIYSEGTKNVSLVSPDLVLAHNCLVSSHSATNYRTDVGERKSKIV